jgi:hypothetical protein
VREERDLPSGDTPHDENVTMIKSLRELLDIKHNNHFGLDFLTKCYEK